ncbi:MAG TPA: hypothetical protein VEQ41_09090 [Solirubrobacterales bacterium]|nr:hypothetical protein [Solirubrobacterales bacterium]
MPLEGIRAWIGEVERKLGMRTRVFLVLAALAIGGAGAAIYLALDTRDNAVSEGDVRALQEDLETRIAGGDPAAGTSLSELEADLRAVEAKVEALEGDGNPDAGATGPTGASAAPPPNANGALPDPSAGAAGGGGIATEGDTAAKKRAGEAQRQLEAFTQGQEKAP